MTRDDPRWLDARLGHIVHQSARGTVLRNNGNYTRGGQLLGSQWRMFVGVNRVPFFTWLGLFLLVNWFAMSAVMGPHEVQLCCWRLIATIWNWAGFSPAKPMNLIMPDGMTLTVPMIAVNRVPAVALAWARFWTTLLSSMLVGTGLSIPLIVWFTQVARKRGEAVLKDRHERGAMLVPRDLLLSDILAHNRQAFATAVARIKPATTVKMVMQMPFAERKAAGIHHAYTLADVPYPYGLEQSHTIVIGTTGAGKTTQLRDLVRQIRQRQDSAVIFDLTGAYVEAFYDEKTDVILNPIDTRCPAWSIFTDCKTEAQLTAAAAALIPNDGGQGDPFWITAARTLFVEMCKKLIEDGSPTNKTLADKLMKASLDSVHKYLLNTIADPLTDPKAAKMAESIRATFNTNAKALLTLPEEGDPFSITDWIKQGEKPGHILFVTSRYVDLELTKKLLTLWMDLAINTLMALPKSDTLRTWFIFDEFGALHRLPAIEAGLQTARGYGGALVLGLHSFARLKAIYGPEGAENLISLARTKLVLATADIDSAEACARSIGNREVRQMDEAYSYGYNNLRDASTLTPRKQIEPLVLPDDITNLPSLHGFLKFPEGFPAARIKLIWKPYPKIAEGFIERTDETEDTGTLALRRKPKADDEGTTPLEEPAPEEPQLDLDKISEGKDASGISQPEPTRDPADGPIAVQDTVAAAIVTPPLAEVAIGVRVDPSDFRAPGSSSPDTSRSGRAASNSLSGRSDKTGTDRRNTAGSNEAENERSSSVVTESSADVGGYNTNDPHNHPQHHHHGHHHNDEPEIDDNHMDFER